MKRERAGPSLPEDAVKHERVEVDVEIKTAAEALDHRDGAGLAGPDALRVGGPCVEGEQYAGIDA